MTLYYLNINFLCRPKRHNALVTLSKFQYGGRYLLTTNVLFLDEEGVSKIVTIHIELCGLVQNCKFLFLPLGPLHYAKSVCRTLLKLCPYHMTNEMLLYKTFSLLSAIFLPFGYKLHPRARTLT